jgi:hypothetical protein
VARAFLEAIFLLSVLLRLPAGRQVPLPSGLVGKPFYLQQTIINQNLNRFWFFCLKQKVNRYFYFKV